MYVFFYGNETNEHNIAFNRTASVVAYDVFPVIPSWFFFHLIPVLASLMCLIGLLGNGVVIFIMLKYPKMTSVPNTYILNLAAADFLFFLGVPFLTYFNTARRWTFGNFMCKLVMGIDGMNMFTGIFTLAAMAVDRYFAIVRATFSTKFRSVFVARFICAVLWLLAVLVTLPLWTYASIEKYDNITVCSITCSQRVEHIFVIYSFLTGFVIPLAVIIVCYLSILCFLARQSRKFRRQVSHFGRVSAMVLTTVVFFFVCWLPFWVTRVIVFVSPSTHTLALQVVYYLTPVMSYINSCFNPVIYTWFKDDFRDHLKRCMCTSSHKYKTKTRSKIKDSSISMRQVQVQNPSRKKFLYTQTTSNFTINSDTT
ncbi:somatostatin receptor type 5-like [Saccoglossus kowalevskii]|uniref:Somatostatin receptor type 5-like n=1 Tax=Saccoglossus kowalevskii TaxID=10224 RepID=A0ABM0GPT9_SACKO|nr:PREDICTED: somatostatin receptor type 5-like [Saccoglossus kowalevskii]